MLVKHL